MGEADGLREYDDFEEPKFPGEYTIDEKIKAPLNSLWYNVNTIFPDDYPAKMSPDFARDMIQWFSKKGETVWDGFAGSGTVPRIANRLERVGIGTDVNPKAIDLCQRHDPAHVDSYWVSSLEKVELKQKADLILTSPPFGISIGGDKNNYSEEKEDLSNSHSVDEFLDKIRPCFKAYFDNLRPNGLLIFDSRDRTKNSIYYDLNVEFRNICVTLGFKVHCVFHYFLMPWSLYTYRNKENQQIVPNVAFMDAYVLYKPAQEKLF